MDIIKALSWRYAVKNFDPQRKVCNEDISVIKEALTLTASSFGLQPWKFIFVTDQKLKEALLAHSWNQRQVVDCSHLIIMARPESFESKHIDGFIESTAKARDQKTEDLDGYRRMMSGFVAAMNEQEKAVWMEKQIYISLGNLLTSLAMLEIDSCPMEGIIKEKYDELLGLDKLGLKTVVACPIGYRSEQDKYANLAKVRYMSKDVTIDM